MYRWEEINEASDREAREQSWEQREDAIYKQQRERELFEDRAGFGEAKPDPRPTRRHVASPSEWKRLRDKLLPGFCEVCGGKAATLHHAWPKSLGGGDVLANLSPVCGDGTTGCHGALEARRPDALDAYRRGLRPETVSYLIGVAGLDRFRRMYPLFSERAA